MLEFLSRWTPLAQFFGPLIAGIAAVFAARSASSARRAAEIASESDARARVSTALEHRPEFELTIEWARNSTSTAIASVRNTSLVSELRNVRVLIRGADNNAWREVLYRDSIVPNSSSTGSAFADLPSWQPLRFKGMTTNLTKAVAGRVEFEDEQQFGRWTQSFRLANHGPGRGEEGPGTLGVVALRHPRLIGDGSRSGDLRRRLALAWQVARGRRQVLDYDVR